MDTKTQCASELLAENEILRSRLKVAEEALRAIGNGEVDTLVISSSEGPLLYTLQGLDAASSRFRGDILAQVRDAVVAIDAERRVTYLNAAAEQQYGISAADVLGKNQAEVFETRWFQPGDEDVAQRELREFGEWRGENIHVRLDGRALSVESSVTVLSAPGQQAGVLSVIRDISDRKQVQTATRMSEIRYRRLFEAAQDGVLLVDPTTRKITDANPFIIQLLGYTHDQLVGKDVFEIGLLNNESASHGMFHNLRDEHRIRYENMPLVSQEGRHQDVEVVANLYDDDGRSVIQFNIRDITERRHAEENNKLLMAEVNHRSMNLLAVVEAVVQQTARGGDTESFVTHLSDRIRGLAASQDLLVKSQWKGVELEDLVRSQLAHFGDLFGTRVLLDGGRARLKPAAAQGIGMALHELATNAGKYGALSNNAGRVYISWHTASGEDSAFSMSWLEEGGPAILPPTRKGFGQMVIGRMVEASVDGTAKIDYRKSGFSWTLTAPIADTLERGRSAASVTNAI